MTLLQAVNGLAREHVPRSALTYAALEAIAPLDGEIGTVPTFTGTYVGKDGIWWPTDLNNPGGVIVTPIGTAAENGLKLEEAHARALSSLTPNGAAISATNKAAIHVVGNGKWQLSEILLLDPSHVDFIGWGRNEIITSSTSYIKQQNDSSSLRNFVISGDTTFKLVMVGACAGFVHENLEFVCATDTEPAVVFNDGATIADALIRRVMSMGSLYSAVDLSVPPTFGADVVLEDCEGGENSFGGSNGWSFGLEFCGMHLGRLFNVRMKGNNTAENGVKLGATAVLEFCDWGAPIRALVTGARVRWSRISPAAGEASLNDDGTTARTIYVSHSTLSATGTGSHVGLGANVTNGITTHYNVLDANG